MGSCVILVNVSNIFLDSSTCPIHLKLQNDIAPWCVHQIQFIFVTQLVVLCLGLVLLNINASNYFSIALASFYTMFAIATEDQLLILLLWGTDYSVLSCPEFNSCFTQVECILYETITFLNLVKLDISIG